MLRPETPELGSQHSGRSDASDLASGGQSHASTIPDDLDIQNALGRLEELILSSQRLPFSRLTLVDEDQLLDQLDTIRLNLPSALQEANQIVQRQDAIISQAESYAQGLVQAAEQQAAQMLDELGIIRQAEQTARQLQQQAQQNCEQIQTRAVAEIDQMRLQAQQEWEALREQALLDKAAIQKEADTYAYNRLLQLEQSLGTMLQVVYNGRQQLQSNIADSSAAPTAPPPSGSGGRSPSGPGGNLHPSRRSQG